MKASFVTPNAVTYGVLMVACARTKGGSDLATALRLKAEMGLL